MLHTSFDFLQTFCRLFAELLRSFCRVFAGFLRGFCRFRACTERLRAGDSSRKSPGAPREPREQPNRGARLTKLANLPKRGFRVFAEFLQLFAPPYASLGANISKIGFGTRSKPNFSKSTWKTRSGNGSKSYYRLIFDDLIYEILMENCKQNKK